MEDIGNGYIKAACDELGVKRHIYNRAVKKLAKDKPLSKDELDVLSKYDELIEDAKRKRQKLKSRK